MFPDVENQMDNSTSENRNLNADKENKLLGNPRLGFVRKVYGILCAQLIFTSLMCIISMSSDSYLKFQKEYYGFMIFFAILSFVILIFILCKKNLANRVPTNYILLFVFTFCEGYSVSFICASIKDPKLVVMAACLTLGITLALTLYAFTTKTDITYKGASLFIWSTALFMFGIGMACLGDGGDRLVLVYCTLSIILYSYYLVYDTQLIMGGKRFELTLDDYIIGAIIIYIDIIILFLRILRLLAASKK